MRVFVVLASLVALISADVSHLHGGHKTTTYTHSVPSVSYGSSGSYQSGSGFGSSGSGFGSSGFSSDPVVNFVSTPVHTTHNYIKPAVQTVTRYVEQAPAVQHHYVQQSAPVQTHYVQQAAPVTTTHYVQQAPAVQTHYVQQAAPAVTVSRFGGDSGFGGSSFSSQGSGFGGASYGQGSGFGGSSFGGASFGGASNLYDSSSSYGSGNSVYRTTLVKQTAPIVTKSSYVFAAPEEHEDIQRDQTIVLPRPRVHYNALFVKAPATTVINTPSVALAPQTQEKTLVYVLSDKKRVENHIQLPQLDAPAKIKPEVFFIKNNRPTETLNSQVRYETVGAVNGAEYGAHNGIANAGNGHLEGRINDATSSGQDSHVAQTIFNGLQQQGLQGGIQAFNTLQGQGISVGNSGFADSGSSGSAVTVSGGSGSGFQSLVNAGTGALTAGANFGTAAAGAGSNAATTGFTNILGAFNNIIPTNTRGSFVETIETVQKPAVVSYTTTTTNTGSSGNGGSQYYTGAILPTESRSASSAFESESADAGSSFAEFSADASDSSDSIATSDSSASGCTSGC